MNKSIISEFIFQLFSSAGYNVALYDTVASQLSTALTSIEAQLCDMESKGLMRVDGMTAQKGLQLVSTFDDLQKAVDGALYVQVGKLINVQILQTSLWYLWGEVFSQSW